MRKKGKIINGVQRNGLKKGKQKYWCVININDKLRNIIGVKFFVVRFALRKIKKERDRAVEIFGLREIWSEKDGLRKKWCEKDMV